MEEIPISVCKSLCSQASIDFYDRCKEFVKENNGIGVYSIYGIFNQVMSDLCERISNYNE